MCLCPQRLLNTLKIDEVVKAVKAKSPIQKVYLSLGRNGGRLMHFAKYY